MTTTQLELTEPVVKKAGKKWKVLCPACGDVGAGANTTEEYARKTADAHVAEAHPDWAVQPITRPPAVLDFAELPTEWIEPSPANPRGDDMGDLAGLKASIESVGILQALTVERTDRPNQYRLIAGQRRWTAACELGLATVPALIRDAISDDHALEAMLVENLQREDVNPVGEARAFARLGELGLSQRTIAARVGCTQAHVSKRLALLELPVAVQNRVTLGRSDNGGISVAAAQELLRLKDDPKAVAAIAKGKDLDAARVAHQVEQKLREAKAAAAGKRQREEIKAAGWTVLKSDNYRPPAGTKTIATGSWPNPSDLKVDLGRHKKEPCHGVVVRTLYDGSLGVTHCCTDPARHKPKGTSALKVPVEKRETHTKSEWELEQEAWERGRKAAIARRAEALVPALAKKVPVAEALPMLAEEVIDVLAWDTKKLACTLLGLDGGTNVDADRTLSAEAAKSPEALVRVAVACVMARGHERARQFSMHTSSSRYGELGRLYGFLRSRGYELDEWERAEMKTGEEVKAATAGRRQRLAVMVARVAPEDAKAKWLVAVDQADDEAIDEFFGDEEDTPVDEIGDDLIARQQFTDFFELELEAAGWTGEGADVRTCRKCGCTDEMGCAAGCSWVAADLCSECTDEAEVAEPELVGAAP